MKESDFDDMKITNFTKEEIESTGAKLGDVSPELIYNLDCFRKEIGRVVVLLPNGLTTGEHKSEWHGKGLAVDTALQDTMPVDINLVFCTVLRAGFTGIGIYWNGAAWSFHFDLRPAYTFWRAIKGHRETAWIYLPFLSTHPDTSSIL